MGVERLPEVERDRERLARSFDCPVCRRGAGRCCVWTFSPSHRVDMIGAPMGVSHVGRYRVAWQAGVMPELGWMFKAVA